MGEIEFPNSTGRASLSRRVIRSGGKVGSWIFRSAMKLSLIACFVGMGLFIGGFLQFTNKISNTVQPADIEPAHAIVALTGGSTRIATALELLSQEKGQRLLISGVNIDTKKSDIAAMHQGKSKLFACCVDVERIAVDTIGNAVETAKWMQTHKFESLILVTSAYHMPRSLLEYRRQMVDVKLMPYAVPLESINRDEWWKNASTLRFMVNEYLKYFWARARNYIHPQAFETLRDSMWNGKQA